MATALKEKIKTTNSTASCAKLREYMPLLQMIAKRNTAIPILSQIRINGGTISVSDIDLFVTLDGCVAGSVDIAAPAKLLGSLLENRDSDVSLSAGEGNKLKCEIVSDSSLQVIMQCMSSSNFPSFPEQPKKWERIETHKFVSLASRVIKAISIEESRYTLSGALVEASGDILRMTAMDGHRLHVCETGCSAVFKHPSTLMSRRALKVLLMAAPIAKAEHVLMSIDDEFHHYRIGPLTVQERVLKGQFPNVKSLLATAGWPLVLTVKASEITAALTTAKLFADSRSNAVRLTVEKGKLIARATDVEHGECRVEVPADIQKEQAISIGFNADYLIDFFSDVQGEAEMTFKDGNTMGLFRSKDDYNYRCLVMPMRM